MNYAESPVQRLVSNVALRGVVLYYGGGSIKNYLEREGERELLA